VSVGHLPWLDPDRWYVINVDRTDDTARPSWQSRLVSLHGPNSTVSAEWSLLGKHGFGWGFRFGRNGSESDLGLNLYAGRLASLWLRLRAPWTKWARVTEEADPKGWHNARHSGVRIHPHEGCQIAGEWEAYDGHWSRSDPWWRQWSITTTTILGRTKMETTEGESGATVVPLPEGNYLATWQEKTHTTRYRRAPGTWLDRLNGPRVTHFYNLSVEGGIPVEGKGENSYDCGMDGVFDASGSTVPDAVAAMVRAVLRDRDRYGGPHNLTRPMTVAEAGAP